MIQAQTPLQAAPSGLEQPPTARQRSVTAPWWAMRVPAIAAAVAVIVGALRAFALNRSYNIFIDEQVYLKIARQAAANGRIDLFGRPFFLHPPAFFYLEAAYLKVTGSSGDALHQIYDVRYLNVGIAALTGAILFLIAQRCAGIAAGLYAALFFSLDPFIVQTNSRNMLETPSVFWASAGIAVLIWAHLDGARLEITARRAVTVGVLFGLAILTKDMLALITVLPLSIFFVTGWVLARRRSLLIIGASLLVYCIYPAVVFLVGEWPLFAATKLSGIQRFSGLEQATGFHHAHAPSLLSTVVDQITGFGTTYLLIGAGVLAVLPLLRSRDARERLVGVWAVSAYCLLAYGVFVGTIEEQFFYYLIVPAIVAVAIYIGGRNRRSRTLALPRLVRLLGVLLIGIVTAWNGYQWTTSHFTPSNGYERALTYIATHVPPQERHIAASDVGAQFLLGHESAAPWGLWRSARDLEEAHPTYLLLSPRQYAWDHSQDAAAFSAWLTRHATLKFYFSGIGDGANGPVALYKLNHVPPRRAETQHPLHIHPQHGHISLSP